MLTVLMFLFFNAFTSHPASTYAQSDISKPLISACVLNVAAYTVFLYKPMGLPETMSDLPTNHTRNLSSVKVTADLPALLRTAGVFSSSFFHTSELTGLASMIMQHFQWVGFSGHLVISFMQAYNINLKPLFCNGQKNPTK